MTNIFQKNLLFLFSKGALRKTLTTSGGREVSGFFDPRLDEALLGGQRSLSSTAGSRFFCLSADAAGIEADQTALVDGRSFLVDDVRDDFHGIAQILFRAEL